MKITNLIDRDYSTISILEDTRDVLEWLREKQYLAVIDEDQNIVGIVTLQDLLNNPESRNVIDCVLNNPPVKICQTIAEVFKKMAEAKSAFLPVYDGDEFFGVISLLKLTAGLIEEMKEKQGSYQKAVHDLRNPLLNLQGLTNILIETIGNQEALDLLHLSNLSCKHGLDILDDLLFVELDESKPLSLTETEMNHFYRQCIAEQKGLSLLKNIHIVTELSSQSVMRSIDRSHFKRAVQNLISNAIKFSHPQSTIKIESKLDGEQLILKIVDAGIGIPLNLQSDIFNKFTKSQRPGTVGEASTGLGLHFTKQCVEHHNGKLYFKSEEGKGTKFYIKI